MANTVLLCTIGIKWQFASQAVYAYAHDFKKQAGFVLVGACALIRTNTVIYFSSSKTLLTTMCIGVQVHHQEFATHRRDSKFSYLLFLLSVFVVVVVIFIH